MFSLLFLKIVHSVPSQRSQPSLGHWDIPTAAFWAHHQHPSVQGNGRAVPLVLPGSLYSKHHGLIRWPLLPPVPLPDSIAGSASPEVLYESFVSTITLQQSLAQPQKSLLAPSLCKYAQAVLKMWLVYSVRRYILAKSGFRLIAGGGSLARLGFGETDAAHGAPTGGCKETKGASMGTFPQPPSLHGFWRGIQAPNSHETTRQRGK